MCLCSPPQIIDEEILCVHGGLSPDVKTFDQVTVLPSVHLLLIAPFPHLTVYSFTWLLVPLLRIQYRHNTCMHYVHSHTIELNIKYIVIQYLRSHVLVVLFVYFVILFFDLFLCFLLSGSLSYFLNSIL